MMVTDETKEYILKALQVDFLTEHWEIEQYVAALMSADRWGQKVSKENEEYKKKHRLIDVYRMEI